MAVVVTIAVAACHGESPHIIDGGPADPDAGCGTPTCSLDYWACSDAGVAWHSSGCNPIAAPGNQGCDPGQRCVWYLLCETADGGHLGTLGCVRDDGTAGLGEACTPASVETPDDCENGLVCVDGTCHDVCGFDGSANAACAPGFNCTRHDGLYTNGDNDPYAGALFCLPESSICNPLGAPGNQGCDEGFRCTWSIEQEEPERLGKLACVPEGTLGAGEACTPATVGLVDDCQSGLICAGGVCADICGFDGSAAAACAPGW